MKRRSVLLLVLALVLAGVWLQQRLDSDDPGAVAEVSDGGEVMPTDQRAEPQPPEPTVEEVVSESGIPLRLIRPAPQRKPEPPYGNAYAELEPLARAGDRTAQYRLGMLLYDCRDTQSDPAALAEQISRMQRTRKVNGYEVNDPKQEEQDLRRRTEECAGVPQDQRDRYRDWIKAAADAGLVEAQLGLMFHLPKGEYCQFIEKCSPQQREQMAALQKEAQEYVGKARDAGSAQALWTFGAWYMSDEVLEPNDIEAYAHFRALDQIFVAAGEQRRFEQMLASLGKRLRPVEMEQAEARSRELLSNPNCCVLTR